MISPKSRLANNFFHLPTKEDMIEFYNHGLLIIDYFKKHRGEHFSKRGYSLIGCEIPVELDLQKNIKICTVNV